jgi:hypothetical protein
VLEKKVKRVPRAHRVIPVHPDQLAPMEIRDHPEPTARMEPISNPQFLSEVKPVRNVTRKFRTFSIGAGTPTS